MNDDLISRQAAIDLFPNDALGWDTKGGYVAPHLVRRMIEELPSAQPERKHGKWVEKHHFMRFFKHPRAYNDEESAIEEWQSCRCSVCGRYDTRPYMYYFDEPNYCSYCGADMSGE